MQTKAIFILGGYGYTGKLLAKHLLAQTDAQVIIAGRNPEKAKSFADALNDPRVSFRQADASDPQNVKSALQGVTLCLVAAPTTQHAKTVVRACIDAWVDYLDTGAQTRDAPAWQVDVVGDGAIQTAVSGCAQGGGKR